MKLIKEINKDKNYSTKSKQSFIYCIQELLCQLFARDKVLDVLTKEVLRVGVALD